MDNESLNIPYDIYESTTEMLIIMPLGGVKKESLEISIQDYKLYIHGIRGAMNLKEDLVSLKEECYRGPVEQIIDLPPHSYFDQIHSTLSIENILSIIIPKNIVPDKIEVKIQEN